MDRRHKLSPPRIAGKWGVSGREERMMRVRVGRVVTAGASEERLTRVPEWRGGGGEGSGKNGRRGMNGGSGGGREVKESQSF